MTSAEHAGLDPLAGQVIDERYRVGELLGEGGMGRVYRALHVELDRPCAIKVLKPELSRRPELMSRFRQEARSASALGNPHIVEILDFGRLPNGSAYFVMELLGGRSLRAALASEPFPISRIVTIGLQLCDALGAAHRDGVVHRDLKPDNVQLIERGPDNDLVKVLDFGVAKASAATSELTKPGAVLGTPHYMAPEQCAGEAQIDARTDVYALGVMLYEMSTGQVPFDADSPLGIMNRHLVDAPKRPSDFDSLVYVPHDLDRVILRCLAKSPEGRYPSMEALSRALTAVQDEDDPAGPSRSGPLASAPAPQSSRVRDAPDQRIAPDQHAAANEGPPARLIPESPQEKSPELPLQDARQRPTPARAPKPGSTSRPPRSDRSLYAVLAAGVLAAGGLGVGFGFGGLRAETAFETETVSSAKEGPGRLPAKPAERPRPASSKPVQAAPARATPMRPQRTQRPQTLLTTVPQGAEVFQGADRLGRTPLTIILPAPGSSLRLELRLQGYEPYTAVLDASMSGSIDFALVRTQPESEPLGPNRRRPDPGRQSKPPKQHRERSRAAPSRPQALPASREDEPPPIPAARVPAPVPAEPSSVPNPFEIRDPYQHRP